MAPMRTQVRTQKAHRRRRAAQGCRHLGNLVQRCDRSIAGWLRWQVRLSGFCNFQLFWFPFYSNEMSARLIAVTAQHVPKNWRTLADSRKGIEQSTCNRQNHRVHSCVRGKLAPKPVEPNEALATLRQAARAPEKGAAGCSSLSAAIESPRCDVREMRPHKKPSSSPTSL